MLLWVCMPLSLRAALSDRQPAASPSHAAPAAALSLPTPLVLSLLLLLLLLWVCMPLLAPLSAPASRLHHPRTPHPLQLLLPALLVLLLLPALLVLLLLLLLDCSSRSQRVSCAALVSADQAAALQHPLLLQPHSQCQLHPLELHLLCQLHTLELCVCSLLLLARLHAPDTCCLCHAALPVSGSACACTSTHTRTDTRARMRAVAGLT
jgi:hypothetical protein